MRAPLNASATTAGSLLAGATFQIPAYQRDYAWDDAEVAEFWNDISHAVEQGPYFLGLIILTGEEKRKQVVDGQQRLLTLTLLAAALRHAAVSIGRKALADRIYSNLLRSMDYSTDEMVPRIILTDTKADEALQSIVDHDRVDSDLLSKGSSAEHLWSAYQYLRDRLRQEGGHEGFRQLGAWAEFINEQLYVAVFEHPDEAAAYSVFEVVNTRGRQLTTADLLKNFVLRETPATMREARYAQWHQTSGQFQQLGGQNFVQYIRHVINLSAGYVLPKDLYNYIARRGEFALAKEMSIDKLMEQLQTNLPLYLQMIDPTLDGPAEADALGIFAALNELRVSAVRPLLLAISGTDDAVLGMQQVLRLIVKRIIVGNLGASSVERKFAEAAHAVYQYGSWHPGIDILRDLDHPRRDFISVLGRRSYNRDVLTFIRRSIVCSSITPKPIGTLQYLRPRQSVPNWSEFSDDYIASLGSTVGNTILVNIDRRPRGANSWEGVRQHLLSQAVDGEITSPLQEYSSWTPDSVQEVSSILAEAAADVWC
ncbi:DUF262 domain-containing protein [Nonomuraea gerenzanensis]|uniref:DUF262 domain-containing protein n=1 Tax=Nonomuraea gerenzanensis TaxID=93944 RepID=UPI001CDA54E2|nr:DUF262 domain-containing protein [Nonomuraea gerenzanensis]UBU12547.1 DUF262 domain-containing protein [Nonomuraea gerenzanensis]